MFGSRSLQLDERWQASRRSFEAWILTSWKVFYTYATAKWQLPLKPPYKRLRRWHLKILISVRKVFSEESEWKSDSSYWLLKSEDNGSGKMAAYVGCVSGVVTDVQ
ncbi:uncharacterized protein TNCV_3316041 [Trichonephila clavipes]|nr:uncharacterized protein TNCV_3316041 [Trichonephila clavipes]